MKLRLIEDARDIDRLVGVTGEELRTGYSSLMNSPYIYDPFTRDILDYFTMDELDMIMDEGETFPLDSVAGTVYTVINW
jgi:hypothetical protein